MTFISQIIPKELLKFRLNKQLNRLRQIFSNFPCSESEIIDSYSTGEEEKEDKFQLYQRVLSWFIMGRLAKNEYDLILQNILINYELIELHNKVIELLRAIYCDSGSSGGTSSNLLSSGEIDGTGSNIFNSFAFEFSLLPAEEADFPTEKSQNEDSSVLEAINEDDALTPASTPFISNPKIKSFHTSIENLNLTPSEEALLAEALRNPLHELATNETESLNYRKSFDVFTGSHRLCTELSTLPDQNIMKQRFLKIASNFNDPNSAAPLAPTISDSVAVLACKALEDYMKTVMENLVTLKCGRQTLLRAPISYIFPNEQNDLLYETETEKEEIITVNDLNLLFRLKPWLLADMESFLEESFE